MPTGTINSVASVGGLSVQSAIARTAVAHIGTEKALPKADAGELTTRTNDTDGELTMDSGDHSIETGDVIDIYWSIQADPVQATAGIAYGATVGAVVGTAVPFTAANGDALPVLNSVVNADEQVPLDVDFDGDLVQMLAVVSTKRGHVVFEDNVDAELYERELVAGEGYEFAADSGQTNELEGNPVDEIHVSNGDALAAATFKLGILYDADE